MSAPNVAAATTCTSDSNVLAVTNSATAIVTNAAASGKVYVVKSLYVTNIHASATGTITAQVNRSSVDYRIAYQISVAIGTTIVLVTCESPVYLLEGDTLKLIADASTKLEAFASYDILS